MNTAAKSSIIQQVADTADLKMIDLRLSQSDPTDLCGFPTVNKETNKASYMPMDTFPIVGDELPIKVPATYDKVTGRKLTEAVRHKGWFLFLDEMNTAPMSVQAAAYKLVLDKKVGQFDLHPRVCIAAAGNLASDNAIVNRLSTAMQSRMVHLQITLNASDWITWANTAGIDFRVIAYIGHKPDILHQFNPNHDDFTFACARTWEFVSKLIKPWKKLSRKELPVLAGTIGEGPAREFTTYCELCDDLLTIEQIKANPTKVTISDEPSRLYLYSAMVAAHVNLDIFGKLMQFVLRLPLEFQVISIKAMFQKDSNISQTEEWKDWTSHNAQELLS